MKMCFFLTHDNQDESEFDRANEVGAIDLPSDSDSDEEPIENVHVISDQSGYPQ